MGRKFGRLCAMSYLPRVPSPMPTKMLSSSFGYTTVPIALCWKNLLENDREMKKWINDILLKMHPRSACPVLLSNLTFDIFIEYLASKKLSRQHIGNVSNTLSASSCDSYQSALMHLYRMSKYNMDSHFATDLSQFMTGMKRTVSFICFFL